MPNKTIKQLQDLEITEARDFLETLPPEKRFSVIQETKIQLSKAAMLSGATLMQIENIYELSDLIKEFEK